MIVGASSWLGAQALQGTVTATALDTRERMIGTVIAAGGALLCDLDTPNSRLANTLGPFTRLAARAIGRVFGGHRHGTHSLVFCAATGVLSAIALTRPERVQLAAGATITVGQLVALLTAYATIALSVGLLAPGLHRAPAALLTAVIVAAGAASTPPAELVVAAITTGCCSHLLADLLTPEGIEPLWPFSRRRVSLRVIHRTGDRRETLLMLATALLTLAIASRYP